MSRVDLAYIAGILDGEGYIGVKRTTIRRDRVTPGYHARIQVRMIDEGAIRFVAETLGGWYWREKPHANNGRPLYCYQASDAAAERILRSVLPFLRVKAEQARTLIELRDVQSESRKHRTKITGYRNFPNACGTERLVATKALSDEYIARLDALWLRCKDLNRVGAREEVVT